MLWWIAGWKMDSNGIRRRVPIYCFSREGRAKTFINTINKYRSAPIPVGKPNLAREMAALDGFEDFHVMTPVEYADRLARAKERFRQDRSANEGACPSCGSELGRVKGRVDGRRAWRCLSCKHVWLKVRPTKPLKQNFRPTKGEEKILKAA